MRSTGVLRRSRKPSGYDMELAGLWHHAVTHKRPCLVCDKEAGRQPDGSLIVIEGHHVLSKQAIKDWVRYEAGLGNDILQLLLWDPRNGVPICEGCHDWHTRAFRRIPRFLLPPPALEFADSLELGHRIDREYP